ncbi:MAG: endonuclease/exonuclease/phosphatase family protein [Actinomycetota bacterium]
MTRDRSARGGTLPAPTEPLAEKMDDRGRFWRLALVALTVIFVLQGARVLFPILFDFGEEDGRFILAGGLAVAIFLAPLLTPPLLRWFGVRKMLVLAVALVVGLRLLLQVIHPVPFGLAAAVTVVGLVAVTVEIVALRSLEGTRDLALSLLVGLPIDTALRGAFLGWDLAWQDGLVPLLVTVSLGGALLISAVTVLPSVPPRREGSLGHLLRLTAFGPYLMLQVLLFQNLGFVSSSTELSLAASIALVLLGGAIAVLVGGWLSGRSVPSVAAVLAGLALAAVAYVLRESSGAVAAFLLVAGQAISAGLVTLALDRPVPGPHRSAWRTSISFAVGSLTFALLLVLYQIHYVVPLPFSNRWILTIGAALLGVAAGGHTTSTTPMPTERLVKLVTVPLALLLVPAVVLLTVPSMPAAVAGQQRFRLVDFNARLAVNVAGQVDPEGTARAIEGQRSDVVLLQEVGRGWPINGTLDLGEWLSRRLRMPYLFAPAADGQFGNAILSRFPIDHTETGYLPFGSGPQRRSYLLAELDLGGGRSVTVVSVHLQNAEGTTTRSDQIRRLLAAVGNDPRTIIAGDMNMQPDEADVGLFQRAGFVSVQDQAGLGHVSTSAHPTVVPVDRVNWIFATPDLAFTDFVVVPGEASDHLPLAVTVRI